MTTGVVFRAGEERWVIPVEDVRAAVRATDPVRVPGAPPEIAGLVSVRGEILPAVRTAYMLKARGVGGEEWALVVETANIRAALLIDEVQDVLEVELENGMARLPDGGMAGAVKADELLGRVPRSGEDGL